MRDFTSDVMKAGVTEFPLKSPIFWKIVVGGCHHKLDQKSLFTIDKFIIALNSDNKKKNFTKWPNRIFCGKLFPFQKIIGGFKDKR